MNRLLWFVAYLIATEIALAGVYLIMHTPVLALTLSGFLAVIVLLGIFDFLWEVFSK